MWSWSNSGDALELWNEGWSFPCLCLCHKSQCTYSSASHGARVLLIIWCLCSCWYAVPVWHVAAEWELWCKQTSSLKIHTTNQVSTAYSGEPWTVIPWQWPKVSDCWWSRSCCSVSNCHWICGGVTPVIYFLRYSYGVCHLDDNEYNSIKILLLYFPWKIW